jgi:hypothetical protein
LAPGPRSDPGFLPRQRHVTGQMIFVDGGLSAT